MKSNYDLIDESSGAIYYNARRKLAFLILLFPPLFWSKGGFSS